MKITLKTAELANRKGFNINDITQSELQKWLRDIYGIRLFVIPNKTTYTYFIVYNDRNISLDDSELFPGIGEGQPKTFERFETALEEGLIKSLNLLKDAK